MGETYFANEGDEDCWYTEINTDNWTGIIEVRGWEEEDSIILAQEVVSALNSNKSQFRLKLKSTKLA
jgi:hypothetical protein